MKPILTPISISNENSFRIHKSTHPYLHTPWHFHPEYELILIRKGTGTRFVGDHIDNFKKNDLVFLGPKLPHVWKNDKEYYEENSKLEVTILVIHFSKYFWEDGLITLPEMAKIKDLFKRSLQGIAFSGKSKESLLKKIYQVDKAKGSKRLIGFIDLLDMMANATDSELLSSIGFIESYQQTDSERMNAIYEFTMNNFTRKIGLKEIASAVYMSSTGFCRYFKKRADKTYTQFLNEIRIGYACKLLIQDKFPISNICFETGFNNLSNFNEQFKKITGLTPSQYIKSRHNRNTEKK